MTDLEKLRSYKDSICGLVSYDTGAAGGGVPYGDPWQLVSVFDGDTSTNVVCEGYAKAFQYLCNISAFSGDISSILVEGIMRGGTGAGGHMWNIVNLDDGKNYLVDVTNCDAGTIGAPDQLFLVRSDSGTIEEGYTIRCSSRSISYDYDDKIKKMYSAAELSLSDAEDPVHTHNYIVEEEKAPGCTEEGWIKYTCDECGDSYTETVEALGHDYKVVDGTAVAATCETEGKEADQKCSRCDAEITGEAIPALGHAWRDWVTVIEPTEEAEGLEKRTCGRCGEEESQVIPALSHSHSLQWTAAKSDTCTEDGNIEYWTCSKCGKSFIDENAENEINADDVIIKAKGHTEEIMPAVEPTYTEAGLTEGKRCSICGEILVPQEEIPMFERMSIAGAKVSGIRDRVYKGIALGQAPTVVHGDKTLVLNKDYKLSYSKNTNVGTATVTITGINAYKDLISKPFKINPKATSLISVTAASKGFTAKWKKLTTQTTGYQIQYSTSSSFKSGNKTVTITKNSTVTKKVTKLKAKKKYYVRVRTYRKVSGKNYFSAWSGKKAVTTKK